MDTSSSTSAWDEGSTLTMEKLMDMIKLIKPPPPMIVESHLLPKAIKQVRSPRSKKKRICKKWAKDPKNSETFEQAFLIDVQSFGGFIGGSAGKSLIVSPNTMRNIYERNKT